jgi:hypothetical protein
MRRIAFGGQRSKGQRNDEKVCSQAAQIGPDIAAIAAKLLRSRRRALRTGVADCIQHIANSSNRLLREPPRGESCRATRRARSRASGSLRSASWSPWRIPWTKATACRSPWERRNEIAASGAAAGHRRRSTPASGPRFRRARVRLDHTPCRDLPRRSRRRDVDQPRPCDHTGGWVKPSLARIRLRAFGFAKNRQFGECQATYAIA